MNHPHLTSTMVRLALPLAVAWLVGVVPGSSSRVLAQSGGDGSGTRAKFYDFSDMTITPQTKAPGITLIFGESVGRSRCQQDDPDEFRLCLGEIRDRFLSLPKGGAAPVDVALVVVGAQAATALADAVGSLAGAHRDGWIDARAALFPHPSQVPGAPREVNDWPRTYGPDTWNGNARDVTRALTELKGLVRNPSGLSYLNVAVRSEQLIREPFRQNARLLVLIVAAGEDPWGGAAELARALDAAKGGGRWMAHVLCLQGSCQSFMPLVDSSSGRLEPVAPKDVRQALYEASQQGAREANRWMLSENPTTSGFMEVRVQDGVIPAAQYSYDPFERRVRVSDKVLDAEKPNDVQVWYFPFHPSQVLAQVCPAAVQKDAKPLTQGELPCKGWMADEVVSPQPALVIDVVFEGVMGRVGTQGGPYVAGVTAFQTPFTERGIDMASHMEPRRATWRAGAFKVAIVPRGRAPVAAAAADAVIEWDGKWEPEELETLGWRIISRTIRVPISGMPIRFDSLKVFLNGRPIEPTTRDGAGYVLKGGNLFLDVAAPLHRESHIFAVYRHDVKGGKRRRGR